MPPPARTVLLAAVLGATLGACHHAEPTPSQADQQFLQRNGREKGVVTLAGGLQYRVLATGPADGPHPQKGDEVKVDYTGTLLSGAVFDSTRPTGEPAILKLDGLVPAWMEVLPRMRPGDEWLVYAPPALGYGAKGAPPVIPPNSLLVFDIKLLGVLKSSGDGGDRYAGLPHPQQPQGPSLDVNRSR